MSSDTTEHTLRIMAYVLRAKPNSVQVDLTPEFLEEVADEIAHLKELAGQDE